MPDIIRTSRSYAHRRRARGIGGFLAAISAIASFPAAASEQPALSLQELVLTAHRSIDQHEIAFFALIVGVILFAVVTAVMLLRTRARAARLETWSRDEFTRLRDELDRANAVILSEPQIVVDWQAGSDEPGIEGDLSALGVSASHRVLAFGSWLDAGKASAIERAVDALRARGEAFSMTLTTLTGHPIEAHGRAIGGRAVLRLKDASGIKRELVNLVGRYERQSSELAALRALAEKLPSPVWTRDAAGHLTFVNATYTRAVEAKNAADAVERQLELLDSAAREIHRADPGKRRRLLLRPSPRRRRRCPADLRRARFSHRDRQRRHRHGRYRSGIAARRAHAPCRCASPNAGPAFHRSCHVRRRSPAELL